jgi:hypothetical protein
MSKPEWEKETKQLPGFEPPAPRTGEPKRLKSLDPITVSAPYDRPAQTEIVRNGNIVTFPPELAAIIRAATERICEKQAGGINTPREIESEVASAVWHCLVWSCVNQPYLSSVKPDGVEYGESPTAEITIEQPKEE